jgi:hypothetical protein
MKITNNTIIFSKNEWKRIGKEAGWMKSVKADDSGSAAMEATEAEEDEVGQSPSENPNIENNANPLFHMLNGMLGSMVSIGTFSGELRGGEGGNFNINGVDFPIGNVTGVDVLTNPPTIQFLKPPGI